jgi:hypothetical protein
MSGWVLVVWAGVFQAAADDELLGLAAVRQQQVERAREILSADLLRRYVGTLADDALEGRKTGTEGNNKAAAYIAERFAEAGLAPVGDKDPEGRPTYLQRFEALGARTQNVVGLLEGADPKLKEQIVVVGGHYDHLGKRNDPNAADPIFNGADDNASGSSTVMALAVALGTSGLRSRRSILFIAFSGEEQGLFGSRHYVAHPLFARERHAAMLNLDMVGRNADKPVLILGTGSARDDALDRICRAAVGKTGLSCTVEKGSRLGFGDSDHSSFRDARIPAIFFFTGLHPDYHKVSDHADKVEYARLEQISETALFVLLGMCGRPEDFVFRADTRELGIQTATLDEAALEEAGLEESEGAIRVTGVAAGSAAARAGLAPGDLILALAGRPIPRGSRAMRTLRGAVREAEPGKDAPLLILREGKRVTLQVKWEE